MSRLPLGGRVRRPSTIAGAQDGATALEFAILAAPFFFLLLAILELSLIFVANTNLQNATFAAARQIRVGAALAAGASATTSNGARMDLNDFKTGICSNMPLVSNANCMANLYVDVRVLTGFNGTMAASPYSGTTLNTNGFCFYSGASGSVVEMRAYYLWTVFTPGMLNALVNTKQVTTPSTTTTGHWFVLNSQEVFRVEPGGTDSNTGAGC